MTKIKFPNLIIPGAQKSGTTTLFKILNNHSDIYFPKNKEPHFFSKYSNLSNISTYKKIFIEAESNVKIIGDASTSYMYEKEVPKRLKENIGSDIKFIFILRNPAERAVSAFWQLYKRKIYGTLNWFENRRIEDVFNTKISNLKGFIKFEDNSIEDSLIKRKIFLEEFDTQYDNPTWPFRYVSNSIYRDSINNYLDFFSKDQMLFLTLEDFKMNPHKVIVKMGDFVGVDTSSLNYENQQYNKSYVPKKGYLNDIVHFVFPYFNKLTNDNFTYINKKYKSMYYKGPNTPHEIIKHLENLFKDENEDLSKLINIDLSKVW